MKGKYLPLAFIYQFPASETAAGLNGGICDQGPLSGSDSASL